MLGGKDGRTLFIVEQRWFGPDRMDELVGARKGQGRTWYETDRPPTVVGNWAMTSCGTALQAPYQPDCQTQQGTSVSQGPIVRRCREQIRSPLPSLGQ
jgi:hypothetical protein